MRRFGGKGQEDEHALKSIPKTPMKVPAEGEGKASARLVSIATVSGSFLGQDGKREVRRP